MSEKLIVSSSPHVGTTLTTKKIMLHVVIALSFCVVAGFFIYGLYSLLVVGVAVASAVGAETVYNLIAKKPNTINDCSAVVTGMILGLNMPPTVPIYVPIVGSIFAIIIVKMLFGGLGKNFANPAATARVFLLLSWTKQMTTFVNPIDYSLGGKEFLTGFIKGSIDAHVTGATPLAEIKSTAAICSFDLNLLDLFLGKISGSIGEVCAIAIICALIYLLVFKIINWKIPTFYFISVALFTLAFYKNGYLYVLPSLLSGGVLFAGVFMLTDYASSPVTRWGVIVYAIGAGFMTVLIRRFGGFNEGASIAILLMNCLAPLIDKMCKEKPFGYRKPKKQRKGDKV